MKTISTTLLLFLGCACFAQSQKQIENQMAFAKFYGYVKYFYPGDDAAKIDWDKFALYGSQKVDKCKTAGELKDSLNALAKVLMPGVKIISTTEKTTFPSHLKPKDTVGYQEISWQHLGVGLLKDKRSLYQSARTNRQTVFKTDFTGFGNLSAFTEAKDMKGKTFIFSGKAKMIKGDGQGQLWFRVDKENGKTGFFDNMDSRPILSKEWQNFEIKGTTDQDAKQIVFGAFLLGTGKLAVDDITLKVEGNEVYKRDFENEMPGNEPKTMAFATARSNVSNAKYSFIVNADNQNKFIEIGGPENVSSKEFLDIKPFERHASFGEYIDKPIHKDLKIFLPIVLYGNKRQTFPSSDSLKVKLVLNKINGIGKDQLRIANPYLRIGNIINTWNIFQHFFPYFDIAKTDWTNDLKEALAESYQDQNTLEFANTLRKMTAKLKDGHISVWYTGNISQYYPPFAWEWVGNKLVINSVMDSSLKLKSGDIVEKINGENAHEYFNKIHQYISAATPGYLNHRAQTESLIGEKDTPFSIVLASGQEVNSLRKIHSSAYGSYLPKQDTIKSLGNDITYISISNAKMKMINDSIGLLKKSKAIICDLRGYPTDNTGLIEYLMVKDDTSSRWMQIPQIIYPDQEKSITYQYERWPLKAQSPHLTAKIFFLIDGRAISYAESYMSFIEHYKLATIIGQPTAGTNGNVNSIQLPGGYSMWFTGMKVLKHDGSQHHGIGILPNILVDKTVKGISEGRDEILERAIKEASK
ncbi:S41 family peptidase [Pedobacter fastidiosus]|uniref:Peptidase S41 n=1 Tax=Pedobacter fastidiosus TaxID=2765361 RepID=A0ABR7KUR2_9SPHI|nr:S41 family peptidase [Pedobacter fastidiosus]MBC6111839.1 peptidase S41 [Pedobacter fastidiosus]